MWGKKKKIQEADARLLSYDELGVICSVKGLGETEELSYEVGNEGCLPKMLFLIRHSPASRGNFHAISSFRHCARNCVVCIRNL